MPNQQWENLNEIFDAAIALPPIERADYKRRLCTIGPPATVCWYRPHFDGSKNFLGVH
jgi:hypothetical protein